MTTIYFIRHAQADNTNNDNRNRPLTEKGLVDRTLVTDFLKDKEIDVIISSPYKRAVDTISDFAELVGIEIEIIEDLREREAASERFTSINDFSSYKKMQWNDFNYKISNGESLSEVQARNIDAIGNIINKYRNKNIVIGTHGTALSAIINYYDNTYGFDEYKAMEMIMPWVVKMDFENSDCIGIEKIEV